jgi:actin-related protein 5
MEGVLDYIFLKMGVEGKSGRIDRPIVMTEPIANLGYSRKSTSYHGNLALLVLFGKHC